VVGDISGGGRPASASKIDFDCVFWNSPNYVCFLE